MSIAQFKYHIVKTSFHLLVVTIGLAASAITGFAQTGRLEASTIFEKANPSVVLIHTVDSKNQAFSGSGVVLRSDGVIATNFHVIEGAVSAQVRLSNGDIYDDVSILDTDARKDIAILKIKAFNLSALAIADSDSLKIGAKVYTIGSPGGLTNSFSDGIVSSIRSATELSSDLVGFRVIQFTAPISHGSSGGALLDDTGRLLGLVFAFRTDGQNLNVAIPVNYVVPLVANAKGEGQLLKPISVVISEPTNNSKVSTPVNDVTGVYTGVWSSNDYNVSGTIDMTITKVNDQFQVRAVFTGSDYFNQDMLLAKFTELGSGVWQMEYKGQKSKITGTGLFRGRRFVGDYKFKKLLWADHGKWVLEK